MTNLSIVATCVFALLVFVMLLIQFFNIKKLRIFSMVGSVLVIVSAMFMAYSTYYGTGSDLHRYYEMLETFNGKSFDYAQKYGTYKNTILANAFFWVIAQTGDYKLLPFITIGVTISIIIYIIRKEIQVRNTNVNVGCLFFLLVIAVTGIQAFISGIRQHLAVAIFALATYRDMRLGKKDLFTFLLYIVTCMVHLVAVFFVVIRLCSLIKSNIKYVFLLWGLFIPLLETITSSSKYIEEAIFKLLEYQTIDDVDYRFIVVQACVLLLTTFKLLYVKKRGVKNEYLNLLEVFIIFSFGSLPIVHLFSRQVQATIFLSLPLLSEFYEKSTRNAWLVTNYLNTFFIVGLIAYQLVFAINYWQFI